MIGIIGDLHLKSLLGYSDLIADNRIPEKKEVLDFIVKELQDCDRIIFCGDQFNFKNNPSSVVAEFVDFIESFEQSILYILSGNHDKCADGKTAVDFLKHIKNKRKWRIITDKIEIIDKFVFLPYLTKPELGVTTNQKGIEKVMNMLSSSSGDILFTHYAISDSLVKNGVTTNVFDEIVLPKVELEKKYKLIVAGHIHTPQQVGKVLIPGSIFNNSINETQKYIWKINEQNCDIRRVKLPGRGVVGIKDPNIERLETVPKNSIVKVTLTKRISEEKMKELKEKSQEFDAHILVEQYPHERQKVHFEEGMLEFDVKKLLELYAKQRDVDRGWELIK